MTRAAAVATGWLAHRSTGCPLGGPPLPITYRVDGAKAPAGLRGTVEFVRGRLAGMSFTRGVRTGAGVVVRGSTVAQMVGRYRRAGGFTASTRYDPIFQGTFVTVRRRGRVVLGAFATRKLIESLSIPTTQVCE